MKILGILLSNILDCRRKQAQVYSILTSIPIEACFFNHRVIVNRNSMGTEDQENNKIAKTKFLESCKHN